MARTLELHARTLSDSATLSRDQASYVVSPHKVISTLNRAGVSFVLVGAHGLAGWVNEPRGTKDVDVVVALKHLKKATSALQKAFPSLEAEDREVVVRFRDPESDKIVIDLMKPRALYRETFKHTYSVTRGRESYRIPSLEMALTMKFAAMLSPNRQDEDKFQDAHDFILMVKSNEAIDEQTLSDLGDLVFSGGGKRVVELVHDVRAGRKLVL